MAIGDIYQLNVNQILYGVSLANVYTFEQLSDTDPGTDPETSLMEAWVEAVVPSQRAMSIIPWSMSCVTCRKVRPTGGIQFIKQDATAGVLVGEGNAASTCCFVSLYSSTVGRRGRSRHWYSGIPVNSNAGGRLDTGSLVLFQSFLDILVAAIKWTTDNAQFILRIISSVDAIIRSVDENHARVAVKKLKGRRQSIC